MVISASVVISRLNEYSKNDIILRNVVIIRLFPVLGKFTFCMN